MDDAVQFFPDALIARIGTGRRKLHRGGRASAGTSGFQGHSPGHTEEPARQRSGSTKRARFPSQHEKSRLKGVVYVIRIAKGSPAHTEDHPMVPPNQHLKGGLIVCNGKPFKQFPIRGAALPARPQKLAQVLQDIVHLTICHANVSRSTFSTYYGVEGLGAFLFFKKAEESWAFLMAEHVFTSLQVYMGGLYVTIKSTSSADSISRGRPNIAPMRTS